MKDLSELSYFIFFKTFSISSCFVVVTAGEFGKCTREIDYSDVCDYDSSESLEKMHQFFPNPSVSSFITLHETKLGQHKNNLIL